MDKIKIRWEGAGWYYLDPKEYPRERVLLYHSRLDNPRIWAAPHLVVGIEAGADGEPEAAGIIGGAMLRPFKMTGWEFEKV